MHDASELRDSGARLSGNVVLVLLALAVGAASGYAALALQWSIHQAQEVFFGVSEPHLYSGAARLDTLRVLLAPMLGGLLVGVLVYLFVPGARNHGPADVMQAVREGDGDIRLRAGVASAAASALAIGSGASLGRYGPTVHLGASVAAWIGGRLRRVRAERHVLIGCGVAAGISASFSAPLAGVLFAHEVMLETFARRGFVAITVASVTGQAVARAHDARFALASLGDYRIDHNHEYLLFAMVGVCGGLLAIAFIRGLHWSGLAADRVRVPGWSKPAIAGLAVGAIATRYPQILGLGEEAIHDAIEQLFDLRLLLVLLGAKLVAACVCRGFGFPGGVFGPALFLGAMLGSALGQALQLLDPGLVSSVPIYALAGMGAVISCVIGAPLTTILIVFELTGSYAVTTAVMVAVVLAHMTVSRLFPYSWFNLQLLHRGVDLRAGREVRIMRARKVAELVNTEVPTLAPDCPAHDARGRMLETDVNEMLVVGDGGVLVGQVSLGVLLRELEAGDGATPVAELATTPGIVLRGDDSLDQAMRQLRYFMGVSVPVVEDTEHMRLVGTCYQSSVIGAYNDAVERARSEERGED
jgi:CIC family chloride channel protein